MTDLDKALDAAREALSEYDAYGMPIDAGSIRDLLAALDAARGQAVASVQTITSLAGETRKCIIGASEIIDSLPVNTAVYAAPPASACVCGEPSLGVVHRADGPCYMLKQVPPAAVPAGYALVPVEPTQAMLDAAGMCVVPEGKGWLDASNRECWAAMLAAAERKGGA
jgi:hypothetical protein